MPTYIAYPKEKDTPSRKQRKSSRNKTFSQNRAVGAKLRKARRIAKKEAAEAAEQAALEVQEVLEQVVEE